MAKKKAKQQATQADAFPFLPEGRLADCHEKLAQYLHEVQELPGQWLRKREIKPAELSAGAEILAATPDEQLRYLMAVVDRLIWAIDYRRRDRTGVEESCEFGIRFVNYTAEAAEAIEVNQRRVRALSALALPLLKRKLPYREESVCRLLELAARTVRADESWDFPLASIVGVAERYTEANGTSQAISDAASELIEEFTRPDPDTAVCHESADFRKLRHRLEPLTLGEPIQLIEPGEAWSDRALADLAAMPDDERDRWTALLAHAVTATQSKPTKKFLKTAAGLLEPIGLDGFKRRMTDWIPLVDRPRTEKIEVNPQWPQYVPDPNLLIKGNHTDLWKGLVWCFGVYDDEELVGLLGQLADHMFKKIRGHGARSPKVAKACVHVLGQKADVHSVAQLERLRSKIKKRSLRAEIDKAIEAAALKETTKEDLAETHVPTHGFNAEGVLEQPLGEVRARLRVVGTASTALEFVEPGGKVRKTAPAAIKREHTDELKALKKTAKDVQQLLRTQRDRFERTYLEPRTWPFSDFKARFLDHPLVSPLARRLIWHFQHGRKKAQGIPRDATIVGSDDHPVPWIDDQTQVELWHPLGCKPEVVSAWRDWLNRHEVTQPFKQAHREVYVLTDAERRTRTYSNRMAGHVLRQHQFRALGESRGWRISLLGRWDPGGDWIPTLELPQHKLRVELWLGAIGGDTSDAGVSLYVSTDQVRFYRAKGKEPIPLEDVPERVFSEVMRDVDLFVGVASVGNDPAWLQRGEELEIEARGERFAGYWRRFAFGELSETALTRREALERLIPRLEIADRCTIADRFLVVRGELRTYKIHLGSGNVLMEPNDQYLCVVPDLAAGRTASGHVFLPFEGDDLLSVIISKAFLLADDTKIKDEAILSQIRLR